MIELLILIAVVGLVAWLILKYIPMPQPIRGIVIVVAALICVLMALRAFGVSTGSLGL